MRRLLLAALAGGCAAPVTQPEPEIRAHTYSIVARDPETGSLGVAVQSHWFSVGTVVPWAEAGVGAVATQAFAEPAYGPRGLDAMRGGDSPTDALSALVEQDRGRDSRQVAMVDARGRVAAHTGKKCIGWAGHEVGEQFSVQANMMLGDQVVVAMAKAYREAEGPLAERLLAALEAAQGAGGDIRGKQSAALLVVRAKPSGRPWRDRLVDLRVEDHEKPLAELARLLNVHRAYERSGRGDNTGAIRLLPGSAELRFWHGAALARSGKTDEAAAVLAPLFEKDANWAELLRRLPAAGRLDKAAAEAVLERIEEME